LLGAVSPSYKEAKMKFKEILMVVLPYLLDTKCICLYPPP
jgi:hypothetical protein